MDRSMWIRSFFKQLGGEKKAAVYVDFMNIEKVYERDIREVLWHVMRMYDVVD